MAKFADKTGREWTVEITLGDVEPLKELGFDVEEFDLTPLAKLKVLGAVLWHLCEQQAEKAGIAPEAFAKALGGPARFDAIGAVEAALTDFTLPPAVAEKAKTRLTAAREETTGRLVAALDGSSAGAGNSAGSSDSTPGPSPSGT